MSAGRPEKLEVNQELIDKIESMAGLANECQIADALGICQDTFGEYKKRYPEILEAVKRGKSKRILKMADKIYRDGIEGNITAAIFYLKCQAGWKETQILQHETPQPLIIEVTPSNGNGNGNDKTN